MRVFSRLRATGSRTVALGGSALLALGLAAAAAVASDKTDVPREAAGPGTSAGLESPQPPQLTLVWFDVDGKLGQGFDVMAGEVVSFFREQGVPIAWRQGGLGVTFATARLELPVVLLPRPPGRLKNSDVVMGLVPKDSGTVAVYVFFDNVRRALGHSLDCPPVGHEVDETALAVGRVVAHEIVHALAPERPHAREGIMKSSLGRAALLGPRPTIEPASVVSVQAALRGAPAAARNSPALSAAAVEFERHH